MLSGCGFRVGTVPLAPVPRTPNLFAPFRETKGFPNGPAGVDGPRET
jgi:hypothetical protein